MSSSSRKKKQMSNELSFSHIFADSKYLNTIKAKLLNTTENYLMRAVYKSQPICDILQKTISSLLNIVYFSYFVSNNPSIKEIKTNLSIDLQMTARNEIDFERLANECLYVFQNGEKNIITLFFEMMNIIEQSNVDYTHRIFDNSNFVMLLIKSLKFKTKLENNIYFGFYVYLMYIIILSIFTTYQIDQLPINNHIPFRLYVEKPIKKQINFDWLYSYVPSCIYNYCVHGKSSDISIGALALIQTTYRVYTKQTVHLLTKNENSFILNYSTFCKLSDRYLLKLSEANTRFKPVFCDHATCFVVLNKYMQDFDIQLKALNIININNIVEKQFYATRTVESKKVKYNQKITRKKMTLFVKNNILDSILDFSSGHLVRKNDENFNFLLIDYISLHINNTICDMYFDHILFGSNLLLHVCQRIKHKELKLFLNILCSQLPNYHSAILPFYSDSNMSSMFGFRCGEWEKLKKKQIKQKYELDDYSGQQEFDIIHSILTQIVGKCSNSLEEEEDCLNFINFEYGNREFCFHDNTSLLGLITNLIYKTFYMPQKIFNEFILVYFFYRPLLIDETMMYNTEACIKTHRMIFMMQNIQIDMNVKNKITTYFPQLVDIIKYL